MRYGTIEADLESLVDAGEGIRRTGHQSGATYTEACDVAGVKRTDSRAEYHLAFQAYRDGRARYSPER